MLSVLSYGKTGFGVNRFVQVSCNCLERHASRGPYRDTIGDRLGYR